MRKILSFGVLISVVTAVVCIAFTAAGYYDMSKNIDGWKDRAVAAGDAHDMMSYITNIKMGMELKGMTTGYTDPIFASPSGDVALIYKTVINYQQQAEGLVSVDHASMEYKSGINNLTLSLSKLDLNTGSYFMFHDGLLWLVGTFAGLLLACFLLTILRNR